MILANLFSKAFVGLTMKLLTFLLFLRLTLRGNKS